jgi:hypothetical protein
MSKDTIAIVCSLAALCITVLTLIAAGYTTNKNDKDKDNER